MKSKPVFVAAMLAAEVLRAASSLTASSAGAGGKQSGGNVAVDSFVGAGGVASVSATTVKAGFAGQLYDVKSLAISLSPTNVGEGSTASQFVTAGLDDGTALSVFRTNVSWSLSGPISLLAGYFFGMPVYTDTTAYATGVYLGASGSLVMTVLDSQPDNYTTSPYNFAGDGIPDWWQVANFGLGSTNAMPTADPDGDGWSNFAEYFFNTSPTSYADTPSNSITPVIVTNTGQTFFAASLYRRGALPNSVGFAPQIVGDLSTAAWTNTPVVFSTSTTNSDGMVTEIWRDTASATNSVQRFIRVQIYGIFID